MLESCLGQFRPQMVISSDARFCGYQGFLGAGKSTLVNFIVTTNHGYRIAVIVNEYGDSEGIERPLIKCPDVRKTPHNLPLL